MKHTTSAVLMLGVQPHAAQSQRAAAEMLVLRIAFKGGRSYLLNLATAP